MNDQDWQQYLAALPPDQRDLASHIMERINTLLNRERARVGDEHDALEQRITDQRTQMNNVRTIVKDLFDQLAQHRAVNDASNAAGPTKP